MIKSLFIALGITCAGCSTGPTPKNPVPSAPVVMKLWPTGTTTGQETTDEKVLPDRGDGVRRITNITEPSFTVYRTDKPGKAPAILVFPGGGYSILAINKEGTEVAAWLNSIGVTAVVVKYRVPRDRAGAFQDAQRALRLVRHHAGEWNIDPTRIGVMGFSAGGHLAARLSTDFNRSYPRVDDADERVCRPDFCILIYPAYLSDERTNQVAEELPVSANVPPTFILQTEDDGRFVDGAIAYDQALHKANVSSSLHLFAVGGHGYGLRPSKHPVSNWPMLCKEWLANNGIIAPSADRLDGGDGR